jgi:tetratricopeptide (TPR) repeat protein
LAWEKFIRAFRLKTAGQYNREGVEQLKAKSFENAIKYYERALDFDPDNAYAHYGMGIVCHTMALNKKARIFQKKLKSVISMPFNLIRNTKHVKKSGKSSKRHWKIWACTR